MLPTRTFVPARTLSRPEFRLGVESIFDDFLGRAPIGFGSDSPRADLIETEEDFELELDLPGYDEKNIDVTVEQGILSITGSRESSHEEETADYRLRERSFGRFTRSFSVPQTIDSSAVVAEYANGVLRVTLPKAAEAKARRIAVSTTPVK